MREIIKEYVIKIKGFLESHTEEVWMSIIVILVGISAFGLGRSSANSDNNQPIAQVYKEKVNVEEKALEAPKPVINKGNIVASKNGTKYYFTSCSGSSRISDKNKIYFKSEEDAKLAGYSRASNCYEPK